MKMLKHKLRKTTEKISFSKKKLGAKDVVYAKVQKPGKGERGGGKGNGFSPTINDGGYFTGPESFYEVPDLSLEESEVLVPEESNAHGLNGPQSTQPTGENTTKTGVLSPYAFLLPVQVIWTRRATPQEDFLWTALGIENLVIQQQLIVKDLQSRLLLGRPAAKGHQEQQTEERREQEQQTEERREQEQQTEERGEQLQSKHQLEDEKEKGRKRGGSWKEGEGRDVWETKKRGPEDIWRGVEGGGGEGGGGEGGEGWEGSSMGRLRRILEIEEMTTFSRSIQQKMYNQIETK